jgi:hypothetical protein
LELRNSSANFSYPQLGATRKEENTDVNPPFGELLATAKRKSNHVFRSAIASQNCTHLNVLFSTPVPLFRTLATTIILSPSLRNLVASGDPGSVIIKTIPQATVIAPQMMYSSRHEAMAEWMWPMPKLAIPAITYPSPAEPIQIPMRSGCSLRE